MGKGSSRFCHVFHECSFLKTLSVCVSLHEEEGIARNFLVLWEVEGGQLDFCRHYRLLAWNLLNTWKIDVWVSPPPSLLAGNPKISLTYKSPVLELAFFFQYFFLSLFIYFEKEGEREYPRQALHCRHRALSGALIHER